MVKQADEVAGFLRSVAKQSNRQWLINQINKFVILALAIASNLLRKFSQ
ncbi:MULTISPECIES: hypothetical protein [unclassified Campylobacter]|nr:MULTISPECIES: hypothetical protein [unclassified Campylobacter]MDA3090900.1 hypothetical protein [Campylobacter sp. CS_ED2]MDA3080094.1 hypothetical protein [Campylobacter sp. CS_NA2]MDA3081685.1 hypothetical protein [Campylobacter sp. CS_NA1]MDA3086151.1 hypothetical protein [Campylobacter sp. CS_ED1]WBR51169.1 hypothetical protein PF026_07475 [Campylobacter sp. CS_NA3]